MATNTSIIETQPAILISLPPDCIPHYTPQPFTHNDDQLLSFLWNPTARLSNPTSHNFKLEIDCSSKLQFHTGKYIYLRWNHQLQISALKARFEIDKLRLFRTRKSMMFKPSDYVNLLWATDLIGNSQLYIFLVWQIITYTGGLDASEAQYANAREFRIHLFILIYS